MHKTQEDTGMMFFYTCQEYAVRPPLTPGFKIRNGDVYSYLYNINKEVLTNLDMNQRAYGTKRPNLKKGCYPSITPLFDIDITNPSLFQEYLGRYQISRREAIRNNSALNQELLKLEKEDFMKYKGIKEDMTSLM